VVAKCVFSQMMDPEALTPDLEREIVSLTTIRHPHVVSFFGICLEGGADEYDAARLYLVMELCEGTLTDFVARDNGRRYREAGGFRRYSLELVEAMVYMHDQGLCHRDLKVST
jgi:serine/threonine protein kinase